MTPTVVDVRYTIRGIRPGRVPFAKIARAILPKHYQLSLVVCGDSLAQKMNIRYRKKAYRPNVLSFPLAKNEGEIFLNMRKAAREARAYNVSTDDRLAHLFIHACLHLKGLTHGRTMESTEERFVRRFGFKWPEKSTPASTSAHTTSKS